VRLFVTDSLLFHNTSPLLRPGELSTEVQSQQQPFDVPPNLSITLSPSPLDKSVKTGNIGGTHVDQDRLRSIGIRNEGLL